MIEGSHAKVYSHAEFEESLNRIYRRLCWGLCCLSVLICSVFGLLALHITSATRRAQQLSGDASALQQFLKAGAASEAAAGAAAATTSLATTATTLTTLTTAAASAGPQEINRGACGFEMAGSAGWRSVHFYKGPAQLKPEHKSQSQVGQDFVVLSILGCKRGGFYVDLAANDYKIISNSFLLDTEFGWQGICIEANPMYFTGRCSARAPTSSLPWAHPRTRR
eukprot:SRR837773.1625.p1 GENE.SRR837773.1625~~SRR837773.1625.p1  ORF type:complete len:252 (-),score=37.58 SRR837773.1625:275-943(-)